MLNGMLSSFRPSKKLAEAPEPTSGAFSIMVSSQMANKRRTGEVSAGSRRQPQLGGAKNRLADSSARPARHYAPCCSRAKRYRLMNVSRFRRLEVHKINSRRALH